ncbi:MAG: RNA-binding S4 domain-containing protein [Saprospiraceae bacterium]|jgi:ribosome-associated heat shock protein Hsp15|nr:RNA-binding S4 domain-containing protein [Saprospiraceae bacterium]MBK8888495.1 RNA-binding S4 domain-containing protein [Saprospiraceae bacterium]
MGDLNKVRLDKWLWAVRLFKSRTMATDACKAGKIKLNGHSLKPSYLITVGETIEVKKNGFNLIFKVNQLLEKRVSAVLAAPCFEDLTPADELNKYRDWFTGKAGAEFRDRGEGRPTKKDRREIDEFKDMYFDEDDEGL